MLTETLSGKCPCCGYDKLLQRYGSLGYYQLDACANCGFGYGSNHHDDDSFGLEAWIGYGRHILCMVSDDYDAMELKVNEMTDEQVRRNVFDWVEMQERFDDVDTTIFSYSEDDIIKHKEFNLEVFKQT